MRHRFRGEDTLVALSVAYLQSRGAYVYVEDRYNRWALDVSSSDMFTLRVKLQDNPTCLLIIAAGTALAASETKGNIA